MTGFVVVIHPRGGFFLKVGDPGYCPVILPMLPYPGIQGARCSPMYILFLLDPDSGSLPSQIRQVLEYTTPSR